MSCKRQNSRKVPKKECPLCGKVGNYIHYLAVSEVVKEIVKPIIIEDDYYVCPNAECETVVYQQEGEQIFLIQDINMQADFDAICSGEEKRCGSCGNGCGICP